MPRSITRKIVSGVVSVTCLSLLSCSKAPATSARPPKDAAATSNEKSHSTVLVNVDDLKRLIDMPDASSALRILDVRTGDAYGQGHIPQAVHANVDDWKKQALAKGGLQDANAWKKLLAEAGVTRRSHVVVYSDKPADAARVWWTIKYLGVPNVALLDGGWNQWLKENGAVDKDAHKVSPQPVDVDFQTGRLADIDELKKSYKSDKVSIVDARSQREFDSGRIPGSVRLEWSDLLATDGRFKPRDEIRKLFEGQGIVEGKTAITYCQTGGRSSLDAFALELAGFQNVKNYYCSWDEWSKDGDAPVEK